MPPFYISGGINLRIGPVYQPRDVAILAEELSELNNEVTITYVRWGPPAAAGLVPDVALAVILSAPAVIVLNELTKDAYAAVKNKLKAFLSKGKIQSGGKGYAPLGMAVESVWFIFGDAVQADEFDQALGAIAELAQKGQERADESGMPVVYMYDPTSKAWVDATQHA